MRQEKTTILMLEANQFRKQLKALSPFMSTDETRYYLNGVYLTYDGSELLAVATNGHILYEATVPHEGGGEAFSGICPRGAVETLCKMIKDCRGRLVLTVINGDLMKFVFDDLDCQLTAKALSGTFPDYKKVIPEPVREKKVHHDRFNVDYLLAASKVFHGSPVNIFSGNEKDSFRDPHLFTSKAMPGVRCVLMPMNVEE